MLLILYIFQTLIFYYINWKERNRQIYHEKDNKATTSQSKEAPIVQQKLQSLKISVGYIETG